MRAVVENIPGADSCSPMMSCVEKKMEEIQLQVDIKKSFQAAEAFRTLRANLQFCGAKYKVIMVTSCVQSDGKTTISFEIANSYAEDGKRVLLLDTDLRKSVLDKRLSGDKKYSGTTDVLSGLRSFEDCVCRTQYSNLDILFAGTIPPNPVELLGSEEFSSLIAHAKEQYDIVIVDTPPLGMVIDAAIVAKCCDGAVVVICANTVSRQFARNVIEQLRKSECPILGTVLNRVMIHSSRYYKGSYYRYGRYYKKYYRYGYGYGDYGYGKHSYGAPETPSKRKKK